MLAIGLVLLVIASIEYYRSARVQIAERTAST
jgi:hypothetical protein